MPPCAGLSAGKTPAISASIFCSIPKSARGRAEAVLRVNKDLPSRLMEKQSQAREIFSQRHTILRCQIVSIVILRRTKIDGAQNLLKDRAEICDVPVILSAGGIPKAVVILGGTIKETSTSLSGETSFPQLRLLSYVSFKGHLK